MPTSPTAAASPCCHSRTSGRDRRRVLRRRHHRRDSRQARRAFPGFASRRARARTQYRGTKKTPREIGAELGVDYLLTRNHSRRGGRRRPPHRARHPRVDRCVERLAEVAAAVRSAAERRLHRADAASRHRSRRRSTCRWARAFSSSSPRARRENLDAHDEFLRGEQATEAMGNSDPKALRSRRRALPARRRARQQLRGGLGRLAQVWSSRYRHPSNAAACGQRIARRQSRCSVSRRVRRSRIRWRRSISAR